MPAFTSKQEALQLLQQPMSPPTSLLILDDLIDPRVYDRNCSYFQELALTRVESD